MPGTIPVLFVLNKIRTHRNVQLAPLMKLVAANSVNENTRETDHRSQMYIPWQGLCLYIEIYKTNDYNHQLETAMFAHTFLKNVHTE